MKTNLLRSLAPAFLLLLLMLTVTACNRSTNKPEETTLPDVIETVPYESDSVEPATNPEEPAQTEPETEPDVRFDSYPSASLPDYAQYINANRIQTVLSGTNTLTATLGGVKIYRGANIYNGWSAMVDKEDGTLVVNLDMIGKVMHKGISGGYVSPFDAAEALHMNVLVYDEKLVMFYEGDEPLDLYDDLYTLEAMYLYMIEASEEDIVNAFIDLPDVVSNGSNTAIYYTTPDLNLGIQTSVYYAQIGTNVTVGPRLVVGEGRFLGDSKNEANHTVVRVYNEQQAMTAQFLAFDVSVRGGVQVACAGVGQETLIATAPFVSCTGTDGDIRVFDVFGTLRMEITLRDVMAGPYTIVTGRFASGRTDDVLLVTAATLNAEGHLPYALIDLSTGTVITRSTLDCSQMGSANSTFSLSVRTATDGATDSLIFFFPEAHAVYEGSPETGSFRNANITVPSFATGVFASPNPGEKYIITLAETEETENRSFIAVYAQDATDGSMLDVAFRENVFYCGRYWNDNNDTYVSNASFAHIRCDLSNGVMGQLNNANTSELVDEVFDNATYATYAFSGIEGWVNNYSSGHYFFEPCFTHRWNKFSATSNLKNYVDPATGEHLYVSIGQDGAYTDYLELGSSYYIGTYADGILDLAKLRLYPLRTFLRRMAVEFRGENGIPENLVGMSPVHEHEIDVAGTVGDYNVRMIRGFQIYLMEQYGSVENINALFGTTFEDEYDIDPPRQKDRGDWDAYKGPYFDQWVLYNRSIVSKRIIEAYREAMIAGYPPESISAHQIPEAEAVSGLLGDAATRITPIDVVLTCGTAYGGTRYGQFTGGSNFIQFANRSGQWGISIGEYCSMDEGNGTAAFKQLQYLWEHGVRVIHQLPFNDKQAENEAMAIQKLAELNKPRPGYTGGTTTAMGIVQAGKNYTIIQMGEGADSDNEGLLKSVTADGKWEGTVYIVPFHAHVNVTAIEALNVPVEGKTNVYSTGTLAYLKNSDIVELTLKASYAGEGKAYVTFEVYNQGYLMPASVVTYEIGATTTPYRYVLSNQIYIDGAEVRVTFHTEGGNDADIHVTDLKGTLQKDAVSIKFFEGQKGYKNAHSHNGGVTFDIIDRDMKG